MVTVLILSLIAFAGCFYALCMFCDETDNTLGEFLTIRIYAVILMFACGYSICKLTKKWERKGKIKM